MPTRSLNKETVNAEPGKGLHEIIVNDQRKLTVQSGMSLFEALTSEGIAIPSACGGHGMCGYCKVRVLDGAGDFLPAEMSLLTNEEREKGVRLSCQVRVRSNLRIEVPDELLGIEDFECVCEKNIRLTHETRQLRLRLHNPTEITFEAGQFIQFLCPPYANSPNKVYRAYSIASDPKVHDSIELIVRLVPNGICTTYIFKHLKEGEAVRINGPYGDFRLSDTDAPILFIAGGSGIAPIKSMLHELTHRNSQRRATFFFGVRSVDDLFLTDAMKEFEERLPHFTFVPVVADPGDSEWTGATGLVTEAVERLATGVRESEAYLCGSPGMIDACVKLLVRLGMAETNIFYDKFA